MIAAALPLDLFFAAYGFLTREAELLDEVRIREWFDSCLDTAIRYEIPIRISRERSAGDGFSAHGWHMNEDWHSLETRVERLETEFAWAEDPPTRTRRFITNVRVDPGEGDTLTARSNLLLYTARHDDPKGHFLSCERRDLLHPAADGWRLVRRTVLLDHTTIPLSTISVFL